MGERNARNSVQWIKVEAKSRNSRPSHSAEEKNAQNSVPSHSLEEKNVRNSVLWNKMEAKSRNFVTKHLTASEVRLLAVF